MDVPRIESLHVKNFRALRDVEMRELTPLTVLLGPNGSGKSTLFDVFGFLSEALRSGVRPAWDKRGRMKELRSRESVGPISFELRYRERPKTPIITYFLELDEEHGRPIVRRETLRWRRDSNGKPFTFLDFSEGKGQVVSGELPEEDDGRRDAALSSSDLLAVSTLGQLAENPRVVALREFIEGWYLSSADTRGVPDAGPMERLSPTGDNLPNVVHSPGAEDQAGWELRAARLPGYRGKPDVTVQVAVWSVQRRYAAMSRAVAGSAWISMSSSATWWRRPARWQVAISSRRPLMRLTDSTSTSSPMTLPGHGKLAS